MLYKLLAFHSDSIFLQTVAMECEVENLQDLDPKQRTLNANSNIFQSAVLHVLDASVSPAPGLED